MRKISLLILALFFLAGCGAPQKTVMRATALMGTIWDITVVCDDEKVADKAIDEYFDEIARLEKMLTLFEPKSELNILNSKAGTGPVKVSPEIVKILQTAIYVSELSDGAFDVSIGPVVKLWGFAGGKEKVPSDAEIKKAHGLVGYKMITIDTKKSTVTLAKKGMVLDFGGIAKGCAIDSARPIFQKYKIKNVMISAGGQVYVTGKNPKGKDWSIGIIHPKERGALLGVFDAAYKCVATSGNYERFFKEKGKLYHHIFNPTDSYPAKNTISATIILNAKDFEYPNTLADALSTAIFVTGRDKGKQIAEKVKNSAAIIVTDTEGVMKINFYENSKSKLKLELRTYN